MIKELESVASTNTWAKENAAQLLHGDVVVTHNQTSGRGQRGCQWEAEPGKNLTFSLYLQPTEVAPDHQFMISEIVALAVAGTVERALAEAVDSDRVAVKWPNDIYVDDRKIAGILIEHTLQGNTISQTIAGVGLNVNQTEFVSDAPNPVSLAQLARHEYPLAGLLMEICNEVTTRLAAPDPTAIHAEFKHKLWRNDGLPHPFTLPDGTAFEATIENIEPDGRLLLRRVGAEQPEAYFFKEVAFTL